MKKMFLAIAVIGALVIGMCFTACSSGTQASSGTPASASSESASAESSADLSAAASEEVSEEPVVDGSAYGYAGEDPVEVAVYKYMAEEVSKNFEKADVSIPVVNIVSVDYTNPDEVLAAGDFWVDNYNIKGDTLECVSGGNFPGVMHLAKSGEGYVVNSFDMVEDGAGFDSSAKELFGENYDAFMEVYSDSDARDELRKITVSDYVNLNGLDVSQYQDSGRDPVKLYK